MEKIEINGARIFFINLNSLRRLKDFQFYGKPFACLIISNENLSLIKKRKISQQIIDAKCKYVLCSGKNCQNWELIFDETFVEKFPKGFKDGTTLMTSSHEKESVEDIIFDLFFITTYGKKMTHFKNYVLLSVGENKKLQNEYLDEIKRSNKKSKHK